MADEWYYLSEDQRLGPFDAAAMQQLMHAGVIQSDTNVAIAGASGWIPARDANAFTGSQATVTQTNNAPAIVEVLAWGIVPLAVFFLMGPLTWKMISDSRNAGDPLGEREFSGNILAGIHDLAPSSTFDPAKEWKLALMLRKRGSKRLAEVFATANA